MPTTVEAALKGDWLRYERLQPPGILDSMGKIRTALYYSHMHNKNFCLGSLFGPSVICITGSRDNEICEMDGDY